MKFKLMAAIAFAAALYSCDDTTSGVGDFVSGIDNINALSDRYKIDSRTETLGKIYSRTNKAYLGKYTDPDFGLYSADFITQINCPEGFEFPETIEKITETSLGLYYHNYYGDSLATLTLQVDTLDKVIDDEDTDLYYTDFIPQKYYDESKQYLAKKSYAAIDLSVSDSLRNSDGYLNNIVISLDGDKENSFSDYMLKKYNDNPSNYKDAYSFINNVLKGFYVHVTQGEGSVLYIRDIWFRMKFEYLAKRPSTGVVDSTAIGSVSFAASKEVLMSTRMEDNKDALDRLAGETGHTYLKTPAGLYTEITLPIEEIYNTHQNDTLNSVTLSIKKYRHAGKDDGKDNSQYKMGIPQYLLMVREDDYEDFFKKNKIYDDKTSFLGTYDSKKHCYTFSKLNRLVSHIFSEIRTGSNISENRDKVRLIPVSVETDSSADNKIIGISHDLEVNAARLFGGENGEDLEIEITYTNP